MPINSDQCWSIPALREISDQCPDLDRHYLALCIDRGGPRNVYCMWKDLPACLYILCSLISVIFWDMCKAYLISWKWNTLFSKRSAHENHRGVGDLGVLDLMDPIGRALLARPFDKLGMTRGRGQWPGVTRRTGQNQCALLLEKSVLDIWDYNSYHFYSPSIIGEHILHIYKALVLYSTICFCNSISSEVIIEFELVIHSSIGNKKLALPSSDILL